jgi:enediyne biosynthesis protein E5
MIKQKKNLIPSWRDPRWIILAFLAIFAIAALFSEKQIKTPEQLLVCLITCVGLDVLLIRYYKKIYLFPLSGLISTFGTFLLTNSRYLTMHFVVSVLTILSKHFITVQGKHVFNPNNFGVILAYILFSAEMTVGLFTFGGPELAIVLTSIGLFLVYRAGSMILSMTYVLAFLVGVLIRSSIMNLPVTTVLMPMTGSSFMLYTFYMISDPATTPRSRNGQILFGCCLAALDTILRYNRVLHSPLYALFMLTAIYSLLRTMPVGERFFRK